MATNVLASEPRWQTVNRQEIRECFETAKLASVASALNICTNSLYAGDIIFSGNAHVDRMSDAIKREYMAYYGQHIARACEIESILGFVPQTWDDHPVFGALPQHLDLTQVELQVSCLYDGRVIWRAFELTRDPVGIGTIMGSGVMDAMGSCMGRRPIRRLHVYASRVPNRDGSLNSLMKAIRKEYEYLQQVQGYALSAYRKMANPSIITEATESKHDTELMESQDFTELADKIRGIVSTTGTETARRAVPKTVSAAALTVLNSDEGRMIHNERVRRQVTGSGVLPDPIMDMININKGRKVAKADVVAKAPEIVEQQELLFKRTVYELLQIPISMIMSEGSKTSTNQNTMRIYEEGQRERRRRMEQLIRNIYNEMHWEQNMAEFLKGKASQFKRIRRRLKGIPNPKDDQQIQQFRAYLHKKRKRDKQEDAEESQPKRAKNNDNNDNNDDDDLYDYDDETEDGYDSMDEDIDEFLLQSVTPQEAINFSNITVRLEEAPVLTTLTALYKLGCITFEGMRDGIRLSQRYPDFYIAKKPLLDLEKALGVEDDEEALSGSKSTL